MKTKSRGRADDQRAQRRQFRAAAATAGELDLLVASFQIRIPEPAGRERAGRTLVFGGRSESSREPSELVWALG